MAEEVPPKIPSARPEELQDVTFRPRSPGRRQIASRAPILTDPTSSPPPVLRLRAGEGTSSTKEKQTVQLPIILSYPKSVLSRRELPEDPDMGEMKTRIMARLALLNCLSKLVTEPISGDGCSVGCGRPNSGAVRIKGGPPEGKEVLNRIVMCFVFEQLGESEAEKEQARRTALGILQKAVQPGDPFPYAMVVALQCQHCCRITRREIHAGDLPAEELIRVSLGYHSPQGLTLAGGTWVPPLLNLNRAWDAVIAMSNVRDVHGSAVVYTIDNFGMSLYWTETLFAWKNVWAETFHLVYSAEIGNRPFLCLTPRVWLCDPSLRDEDRSVCGVMHVTPPARYGTKVEQDIMAYAERANEIKIVTARRWTEVAIAAAIKAEHQNKIDTHPSDDLREDAEICKGHLILKVKDLAIFHATPGLRVHLSPAEYARTIRLPGYYRAAYPIVCTRRKVDLCCRGKTSHLVFIETSIGHRYSPELSSLETARFRTHHSDFRLVSSDNGSSWRGEIIIPGPVAGTDRSFIWSHTAGYRMMFMGETFECVVRERVHCSFNGRQLRDTVPADCHGCMTGGHGPKQCTFLKILHGRAPRYALVGNDGRLCASYADDWMKGLLNVSTPPGEQPPGRSRSEGSLPDGVLCKAPTTWKSRHTQTPDFGSGFKTSGRSAPSASAGDSKCHHGERESSSCRAPTTEISPNRKDVSYIELPNEGLTVPSAAEPLSPGASQRVSLSSGPVLASVERGSALPVTKRMEKSSRLMTSEGEVPPSSVPALVPGEQRSFLMVASGLSSSENGSPPSSVATPASGRQSSPAGDPPLTNIDSLSSSQQVLEQKSIITKDDQPVQTVPPVVRDRGPRTPPTHGVRVIIATVLTVLFARFLEFQWIRRANAELLTTTLFNDDMDYYNVDGIEIYRGHPDYFRIDAPVKKELEKKLKRVYSMEEWLPLEEQHKGFLEKTALPLSSSLRTDWDGRRWLTSKGRAITNFGAMKHSQCVKMLDENGAIMPKAQSDIETMTRLLPTFRKTLQRVFMDPPETTRMLPCDAVDNLPGMRMPLINPYRLNSCFMPMGTVIKEGSVIHIQNATLSECSGASAVPGYPQVSRRYWKYMPDGNCYRYNEIARFTAAQPYVLEGTQNCRCAIPEVELDPVAPALRCTVQPLTNLYLKKSLSYPERNEIHVIATLDLSKEVVGVHDCSILVFNKYDEPDSYIEDHYKAQCLGIKDDRNMFTSPEEILARDILSRLQTNALFPLQDNIRERLIEEGFCMLPMCNPNHPLDRNRRAIAGILGLMRAIWQPARLIATSGARVAQAGVRAAGRVKTSLLKIPGARKVVKGVKATGKVLELATVPLLVAGAVTQFSQDDSPSAARELVLYNNSIGSPESSWMLPAITRFVNYTSEMVDTFLSPLELSEVLQEIGQFANIVEEEGRKIANFGKLRKTATLTDKDLVDLHASTQHDNLSYQVDDETTIRGESHGPLAIQETTIGIVADAGYTKKQYYPVPVERLAKRTFTMLDVPEEIELQGNLSPPASSCEAKIRNKRLTDLSKVCTTSPVAKEEFNTREAGPYYVVAIYREGLIQINCENPTILMGKGYTLMLVSKMCECVFRDYLQPRDLVARGLATENFLILINKEIPRGRMELPKSEYLQQADTGLLPALGSVAGLCVLLLLVSMLTVLRQRQTERGLIVGVKGLTALIYGGADVAQNNIFSWEEKPILKENPELSIDMEETEKGLEPKFEEKQFQMIAPCG